MLDFLLKLVVCRLKDPDADYPTSGAHTDKHGASRRNIYKRSAYNRFQTHIPILTTTSGVRVLAIFVAVWGVFTNKKNRWAGSNKEGLQWRLQGPQMSPRAGISDVHSYKSPFVRLVRHRIRRETQALGITTSRDRKSVV